MSKPTDPITAKSSKPEPDSAGPPTIDGLRAEIDAIDLDMQRLLERRGEVVALLGSLKKTAGSGPSSGAMRPGREAQILRRVVGRHQGRLPVSDLAGLWRGIVSAYLRLQYPFTVHVATGLDGFFIWDLARVHFGPGAPLVQETGAEAVVEAVQGDDLAVGVVPMPSRNGWWTGLPPAAAGHVQVVARLPFLKPERVTCEALVIARADREASGDDETLIRLSGLRAAIEAIDLSSLGLDCLAHHDTGDRTFRLTAVPGYLTAPPEALAGLARQHGLQLDIIGGYARPLGLKEAKSSKI